MNITLVLLAAGMGSRYGGLKQLDSMGPNGETLMDYSIFEAKKAGFNKVVFIIKRDVEEEFKSRIGTKYANVIDVTYAFQELSDLPAGFQIPQDRVKPWGTGHAIYAARNIVKEPFVLINADDFYGTDGFVKLAHFLKNSKANEYAMCGFLLKNTVSENGSVSRGVCACNSENKLVEVIEHTKLITESGKYYSCFDDGEKQELSADTIVSMNMWGFHPSLFDHLEELFVDFLKEHGNELKSEFYIPMVVDCLVKANKCTTEVLTSKDAWFGITYKEDKANVQASLLELIASGKYPNKLF